METIVFDQITKLIDNKAIEIMVSAIVGAVIADLFSYLKRKFIKARFIQKLENIKMVKVLWFTLAYIFPLGTITLLIIENKLEPNFRNIALFIIICITVVYNALMQHIITLYKMNSELISKLKK